MEYEATEGDFLSGRCRVDIKHPYQLLPEKG